MQFKPFVFDRLNRQIPVTIEAMAGLDAETTNYCPFGRHPGPTNIFYVSCLIGGIHMENRTGEIPSDTEWYCRRGPEEEYFYEIFFQMCQKYSVRWASAEEKERQFIEEVARVSYERERAFRLGVPLSDVRPSFAS